MSTVKGDHNTARLRRPKGLPAGAVLIRPDVRPCAQGRCGR